MKEQSPSDPLEDPAIAALVEGAVARYEGTLSAAEIDALRSILAVQLASHPVLARLMARVAPRAAPHASGEVAADPPLLSVAERSAAEGGAILRKPPGKKAQGAG